MTYGALNTGAQQLSRTLIDMGVEPGDNVALLRDQSFELIIAQVAVLKAGAAYVPIDIKAPASRLAYILSDSGAKLLLTDDNTQVQEQIQTPLHRLSIKSDLSDSSPGKIIHHKSTSSLHTACVMYTSGSTGRPKGVPVPHRAIVCRLINNGCIVFTPDDHVAFVNNPSFDPSTSDVWGPLLHGAFIYTIDNDTLLDANLLLAALDRYQITSLDMLSTLFRQYAHNIGPALSKLSNVPGTRMYKTGDSVRRLSDGELVFLGRMDNQIKFRDDRVELGEIEVRLVEHPAVLEAVEVATGEGADKRLVAYVVVSAPTGNFAINLRQDICQAARVHGPIGICLLGYSASDQ
ncbi:hypothetical protein BGZ93_000246 [Podila epicladia]|nr:hypothetical protein BGZ93_000246 [Podila epicladia]